MLKYVPPDSPPFRGLLVSMPEVERPGLTMILFQSVFFETFLLQISCFFAKASIFLLFKQIFEVTRAMRITIWIGLVLTFCIYFPGVPISVYYMAPHIGENWLATLDPRRSIIPSPFWQAQGALIIALDLFIFVLPLPAVFKLQMPLRKRMALIGVFSVALMYVRSTYTESPVPARMLPHPISRLTL